MLQSLANLRISSLESRKRSSRHLNLPLVSPFYIFCNEAADCDRIETSQEAERGQKEEERVNTIIIKPKHFAWLVNSCLSREVEINS